MSTLRKQQATAKAKQDIARAIAARLISHDDIVLATTDDGQRWLTDMYVATRVTGPLAPIRCEPLVNDLDDGAYKLTVGRGLVPIVSRRMSPHGVVQHLATLEDAEGDEWRVLPTPWLVNVNGGPVALWERGSDSGPVPVGVNAAVAAVWARELAGDVTVATQTADGRPIRLSTRPAAGKFLDAINQREAEARLAPRETVAHIMPVRIQVPPAPCFLKTGEAD